MAGLKDVISSLRRHRREWRASLASAQAQAPARDIAAPDISRLTEVTAFGSNPGQLRLFAYVPDGLPKNAPLVVALHGCTQTAVGYDYGSGWSKLADRYGFAVMLPEQRRSNNPNQCFNWFQRGDIERGQGEPLSIRQMIEFVIVKHGLDRSRVFITGLSAGGAMASVMLATYPEIFAAGAIIAGLPFGEAANVQDAFASMRGAGRASAISGDALRNASPHAGPWPKISVWHGASDPTVHPINARRIVAQWIDIHGLSDTKPTIVDEAGYERQTWSSPEGELVELVTIAGMAHGTPVDPRQDGGGAIGPFFLNVGVASSLQIGRFWGLVEGEAIRSGPLPRSFTTASHGQASNSNEELASPASRASDHVNDVITKALKAAGLMRP